MVHVYDLASHTLYNAWVCVRYPVEQPKQKPEKAQLKAVLFQASFANTAGRSM